MDALTNELPPLKILFFPAAVWVMPIVMLRVASAEEQNAV